MQINVRVSRADIEYVNALCKVASVEISEEEKSTIYGQIFAKKVEKIWGMEGSNAKHETAKMTVEVGIKVTGVEKYPQRKIKTGELRCVERPVEWKTFVPMTLFECRDFIFDGNEMLTFNLKVKEKEWEDSTLIGRIKDDYHRTLGNVNYEVAYFSKEWKDVHFLGNLFIKEKGQMMKDSDKDSLVVWTFNALKRYSKYHLWGSDVRWLRCIYYGALEMFPKMQRLKVSKRLQILNEGISKALQSEERDGNIGEWKLAKCVMESLINAGIHTQFKDWVHMKSYYDNNLVGVDSIKFIVYKNAVNGMEISFSPYNLYRAMLFPEEREEINVRWI